MSWDVLAVLEVVGFGLLGLALGRFILLPLPIVVGWLWYEAHGPHNPDDDVSGPATGVLILLGLFALLVGLVLNRSVRFVFRDRARDE